MIILLQWLVERPWICYGLCAIGAVFYLVRALIAQRERALAQFTLERESATLRAMRSWIMVLVFGLVGLFAFLGAWIVAPRLPMLASPQETPTPMLTITASSVTRTPLPTLGAGSTPTPLLTVVVPTPPPPVVSTPAPTSQALAGGVSGSVSGARFEFATLVGYSLSALEISSTQPLVLTLYWQAEGPSQVSYKVFTHLLGSGGGLVAQHDGWPADGARPTSEWMPGETIVDIHAMRFWDLAYAGPATIEVGLYDEATGERVLLSTGADRVVLPVTVTVVP